MRIDKPTEIRIDKWLWYSRQVKSRTLAQKIVNGGKARVNGEKIYSSKKLVKLNDVLILTIADTVRVLKIAKCGTRRGPFSEAQTLYEDLSPPVQKSQSFSKFINYAHIKHKRPEGRERLAARRLSGKE